MEAASCQEPQQIELFQVQQSPNGPHECTFYLDALPISCLEVQPAQADRSVHRWFVCSLSKFSRHLCKSQHSSPSYLSHQSASETQNCDCLIGYCFTILNEVIFPRTPPSLIIYETNFTPKIFSNQTYWISCHHCEHKSRPLYLSGLPTLLK